ncbi:MAG TPA: rhomboid family intramembrane serine protease [Candidatus Brocadiia bacterium]|nr:rhomboid family intramembrane serine protease [Candidatus Brocadiia bacterium]
MLEQKIWWVDQFGKVQGPYSALELRDLVQKGHVSPHAEVWRTGGVFRGTAEQVLQAINDAQEYRESEEFVERLDELAPTTHATYFLIAANALWFVFMLMNGVDISRPTTAQIERFGALSGVRVIEGEPWRLLSAAFVHVGIFHIALNMWCLWNVGPLLERMMGRTAFAIAYLASALGGSLCGLWLHPLIVSAGASGAVFGLFGALVGFAVLRRGDMQGVFGRLAKSGAKVVAANLFFGFLIPNIDNAAHVGGLVTGAVFGAVLSRDLRASAPKRSFYQVIVALVLIAGMVYGSHYRIMELRRPENADMAPVRMGKLMKEIDQAEKLSAERITAAYASLQGGFTTPAEFAGEIRGSIIPLWEKAEADAQPFEAMTLRPDCPQALAEEIALLGQFMGLRLEYWRLLADDAADPEADYGQKLRGLAFSADEALRRLQILRAMRRLP